MQCPVKGDTPYFTSVQFWMLRRALQAHRQGQKTFPPTHWKQVYTTAIKEGPTLRMAKSTETTKIAKPDMKKCSLPQLGSYMTKTFLSQGLRQMVEQSGTRVSMKPASTYTPLTSCVLGLDPPHSVVNEDASRQEWSNGCLFYICWQLIDPRICSTTTPRFLYRQVTSCQYSSSRICGKRPR